MLQLAYRAYVDIDTIVNAATETRVLTGGRTGASVTKLTSGGESYVLKVLPTRTWRDDAMDSAPGGEAALWLGGVTNELPSPLGCAMVAADQAADGRWRMLMRDIASGIRPRGQFNVANERALLSAVAKLHATWWDHERLAELPVASAAGTTRVWADSLVALARNQTETAPAWVRAFLADVSPMTGLLPAFLDLLSPDDAAFYVNLAADRSWHAGLDAGPQTVVHGDLRRANISFGDAGAIDLIDWEFCARAPATTDLAWHWFLHFWAYPSDDVDPDDRGDLLELYLEQLQSELGHSIDREHFDRQWRLSWLRILVQLGYCMADISDPALAKQRSARAIAWARDIVGG